MSRRVASALALVACSFAFLFRDVIVKLVRDWGADENYSHGFLVVPLVIFILWRTRDELASIPVRPSLVGLVVVIGSVLTLGLGVLGVELFLTRIAMLGTIAGVVLFLWGFGQLRAIAFPLLLLFLAIPIPAIVFNQITFPLQLVASRFGEAAIAACQIPVLREGNIITLANTRLEVAEACSGIRSLVSLLTLALVWGYLSESKTWLRWLLALASVPIAIFANGIRVAGTGVTAHFLGAAAADGFLHTFSGWLVFVVAGALLLVVDRVATWLAGRARSTPEPAKIPPVNPAGSRALDREGGLGTFQRSILVAGCLVLGAVSLAAASRTEAVGLAQPLDTIPLSFGGWEGRDSEKFDPKVIATLRVDEYVNRGYVKPGRPWVSLYIGYYRSQRQGQTMHSPLNCMPGSGWEPAEQSRLELPSPAGSAVRAERVVINRLMVQKGLDRQLVLYWYQAHGRIVASEYWVKIYTVIDAIRLNRSDGALVRVIVPLSPNDPGAEQVAERTGLEFVNTFLPVLLKHLDAQ